MAAGQWETSGRWEGDGGTWEDFSSNDGTISKEFENIMQWDDSGAQEAFQIARERYETDMKGLIYPVSLPSPDLYIQIVDWNKHDTSDMPESADALAARESKREQRRRCCKGERFYQGNRRGIRHLDRHDHAGQGWRQMDDINLHSVFHEGMQASERRSGWDHPMPDVNGLSNVPPQDEPVLSNWGDPSRQLPWQDQTMGKHPWQYNSQTRPNFNGWQWSNMSSEQAALPGGWVPRNDLPQASLHMQRGSSSGYHQTGSGMGDVQSGRWMVQGQSDGQRMPLQTRAGHWGHDNRVAENVHQAYTSLSVRTTR